MYQKAEEIGWNYDTGNLPNNVFARALGLTRSYLAEVLVRVFVLNWITSTVAYIASLCLHRPAQCRGMRKRTESLREEMENLFREAVGKMGAERNGRKRGRIKEKENQDRKDNRTAAPLPLPLAFRFNTWERCYRGQVRDRTCQTAEGGGEPQTSRRPPTLTPLQGPCGFSPI